MMETMNEQNAKLVNKLQEYDLSHKADLRFSSPKLDVKLCDDGASFLPLESGLEDVLDPPLTTLPLIAPSLPSTYRDTTAFPDTPFPLAQSTEFEVGETFGVDASVDDDDTCYESDNALVEVHNLDATPVGAPCVDVEVIVSASPDLVESMYPDHPDALHASPPCSSPSPPPEYYAMPLIESPVILEGDEVDYPESLGTFRGYHPSLDPYSPYLADMPGTIMLSNAFDFSFDFSMAYDLFPRALTILHALPFVCSYLHSSELHAQMFDKLLRALTASELEMRVLRDEEEWLMLLLPPLAPS